MPSNQPECPVCYKRLDDLNGGRVYCSGACRQKAYRRRKKATSKLAVMPHQIGKEASYLTVDAESSSDLFELEQQLIAIAEACRAELRIVGAKRRRLFKPVEVNAQHIDGA